MQGLGHDYIYIDQIKNNKNINFGILASGLCKRGYGVGADGIIVIKSSNCADAKMIIYNSDGSLAKMCGNATRCVAFYLSKKLNKKNITIQVGNQIANCNILKSGSQSAIVKVEINSPQVLKTIKRQIKNTVYSINIVDVGNLHAVVFVKDFNFNYIQIAKLINKLKDFKDGVNVEFVQIKSLNKIKIKVFERGSGLTKACGSGACASAYLYKRVFNKDAKKIKVCLDGGCLQIEFCKNKTIMTGAAKYVYKGEC